MSNVLVDERQQQIRALGRLGWTLSRIQEATGVRRETIGGYLKAAGMAGAEPGPSERIKTKTGNFRGAVHQLDSGPTPGSRAQCERLQAGPRADLGRAPPWPQRHAHRAIGQHHLQSHPSS